MTVAVASASASGLTPKERSNAPHHDVAPASHVAKGGPTKPDINHFQKLIKDEQDVVDKCRKQIGELSEKIRATGENRSEYDGQRTEILNAINALNAQIEIFEKERSTIQESNAQAQNQTRALRSQVETLQKNLPFQSVADIDAKLDEYRQQRLNGNVTLKEDREISAQVQKLQTMRREVVRLTQMQREVEESSRPGGESVTTHITSEASRPSSGAAGGSDRLSQIRDELRSLRDRKGIEQGRLRELARMREQAIAPTVELAKERDDIRTVMAEHASKASQLRKELAERLTEYSGYQARIKHSRLEIDRYTKQLQIVVDEKQSLEAQLKATTDTKTNWRANVAIQLKSYLDELQTRRQLATSNEPAGVEPQCEDPKAGEIVETEAGKFVIMKRKHDLVSTGAASAKSSARRKQKKQQVQQVTSNVVNHSMVTIQDFGRLGVSCPGTYPEIHDAIVALQAIIDAERQKGAATFDLIEKRKATFQQKLQQLTAREAELLASPPEGWKPQQVKKPKQAQQDQGSAAA